MIRLLLETATEVCSVAIAREQEVLAEHTSAEIHQHASHLTLFIQQVLAEADLSLSDVEEVVLSDGPGSYTSLRVGAATAKGLCVALPGLRLRVVPTLTALAQACGKLSTGQPVLAVINSRRGEVYGQLFGGKVPVTAQDNWQQNPVNIRLTEEDWWQPLIAAGGTSEIYVTGPGQQRLLAAAPSGSSLLGISPAACAATGLLAALYPAEATDQPASRLVDLAAYEPFYLNPPFVTRSRKKLLGR